MDSFQMVSQQYEYQVQVPLGEDCISGSRCMYFDILVIVVWTIARVFGNKEYTLKKHSTNLAAEEGILLSPQPCGRSTYAPDLVT